jgi:hypothetical protein
MTVRDLRNQAVFWTAAGATGWWLWRGLEWGFLGSAAAALGAGLAATLVIALATDRFLD